MYSKNKAVKKSLLIVVCIFLLCSSFSVIAGAESASDFTMSDDLMAAVAAGEIDPENDMIHWGNMASGSTVAPLIQIDGVYCLNNSYSGQYLRYSASTLSTKSGYISSLGNPIRWTIATADKASTIRSVSDPTKYLGVTNSSKTASVTVFTVNSGATVPANCKWTISIANGGGCLVKNNYNSGYLSSFGNDDGITVEPTLPSAPVAYKSRVWRIGIPTNLIPKELTAQTVLPECHIMKNYPTVFLFRKAPENAIWTDYLDFSYDSNSSFLSVDYQTGKITGTSVGTGSITVTHKPTGRAFTLTVKVWNPSANKGRIDNWYDFESHVVGRWESSPVVYTQKLDSNTSFPFYNSVSTARNIWSTALGVNMTSTGSSSNANIKIYGGSASDLAKYGGKLGSNDYGYTQRGFNCTGYYSSGSDRKLYGKMTSATVYILSRTASSNSVTNVCLHELGHALGYIGHTNSSGIMYYQPSEIIELTRNDLNHLSQVYN